MWYSCKLTHFTTAKHYVVGWSVILCLCYQYRAGWRFPKHYDHYLRLFMDYFRRLDSLNNNKYTHIFKQTQLSLGFESFWVNQRQQFIKRERSSYDLNPFENHPLRHDVAINLQNICITYKSVYVTIILLKRAVDYNTIWEKY